MLIIIYYLCYKCSTDLLFKPYIFQYKITPARISRVLCLIGRCQYCRKAIYFLDTIAYSFRMNEGDTEDCIQPENLVEEGIQMDFFNIIIITEQRTFWSVVRIRFIWASRIHVAKNQSESYNSHKNIIKSQLFFFCRNVTYWNYKFFTKRIWIQRKWNGSETELAPENL